MAIDGEKSVYWRERFAAWRASGLSRRAFCQREGLKVGTFDYWRGQLGAGGDSQAKPVKAPSKAREITLVAAKRIETASVASSIKLKSERGWELSLPARVEPAWLSALLRALV